MTVTLDIQKKKEYDNTNVLMSPKVLKQTGKNSQSNLMLTLSGEEIRNKREFREISQNEIVMFTTLVRK